MYSDTEVPQVFIDTNVWFSAFYGSPPCDKLLKAHLNGEITAVISSQILTELVRNIKIKIPQALPSLEKLLKNAPPVIASDAENIPFSVNKFVDKKDTHIFASCLLTKTRIFVTGNTKDFDSQKILKKYKISVLTPREALIKLNLDLTP